MSLIRKERRASWGTDLYPELLECISNRLPLLDFVAFRGVCRQWRSAPSGRSFITRFSKDRTWFMFYGYGTGTDKAECYFSCTSNPEVFTVELPDLVGATCLMSKSGWLLAHRDKEVFFYNPFSFARVDLPPYPHTVISDQTMATFSGVPTSPAVCIAFVITRRKGAEDAADLRLCHVGDQQWTASQLIRFGVVNVGRLTLARCCSCNGDGCLCSCGLRNFLFLYDGKWFFYYHLVEGRCYSKLLGGQPENTPIKKTGEATGSMLSKFGRDFSISFCALDLKFDERLGKYTGLHRQEVIAGMGMAEGRCLKAALIEPKFGPTP